MLGRVFRAWWVLAAACGISLVVPALATASPPKLNIKLLGRTGQSGYPQPGFVRTSDGTLHVAYATQTPWGNSAYGIATTSVSTSGKLGSTVQALSGWNTGIPGIAAYPSGQLSVFFGGGTTNNSTGSDSGPWRITSSNGGSSWTSPTDVRQNPTLEASSGDTTVGLSAGQPVLTLAQAGAIPVQKGLTGGPSSVFQITNSKDNFAGNVSSAVDASTGAMIASWNSVQSPGGLWYQQVAPTLGSAHKLGGPFNFGQQQFVLAGRDSGPGVFGAWAPPTKQINVKLVRIGGGTISVGHVNGVGAAEVGVATGIHGRIWVMWWGQNTKSTTGADVLAVTRSNMAVTRFEPIQKYTLNASYMQRLSGDGRLGPLDMLIGESPVPPSGKPLVSGIYYARVLPVLSARAKVRTVKNSAGQVLSYKVKVKVTDAGDPVSGAKVTILKHSAKTSKKGIATIKLPGSSPVKTKMKVVHKGYKKLTQKIHL